MSTLTIGTLLGGVAADTAATAGTLVYRDATGGIVATVVQGQSIVTTRNITLTVSATKTTTYAAGSEIVIVGDCTSAGFTVTLPSAVTVTGQVFIVKKINSANTLTIVDGASANIDGSSSATLTSQWSVLRVISNGTIYYTI